MSRIISVEAWEEHMYQAFINHYGYVPDRNILALFIDASLDYFSEQRAVDFYLEID